MPQTFTKLTKLSNAGTGNIPVPVAATATPGTNVHLGTALKMHEVLLTASNIHTSDVELTLEIGGTGAGNQQKHTIPAKRTIDLPKIDIYGAIQIAGFADSANKININGGVIEIA